MNVAEMLAKEKLSDFSRNVGGRMFHHAIRVAQGSPWIDIQNVIDQQEWNEDEIDGNLTVSCMSPWLECVCFGRHSQTQEMGAITFAVTIRAWTSKASDREDALGGLDSIFERIGSAEKPSSRFALWDGEGAVMELEIFYKTDAGDVNWMGDMYYVLNRDFVPATSGLCVVDARPFRERNELEQAYVSFAVLSYVKPVLTAFAFCNCRNVTLDKIGPSRQVRRWNERHNQPTYEHHVIRIERLKNMLRTEGGLKTNKESDVLKAMHICRGHFARYGPHFNTGKLFGKYEGQFWIPQHVRGGIEKGLITTDYKIA